MNDELTIKLRHIVADSLGYDIADVQPTNHIIADLGADSLDRIELVMAIEEAFDVEISDEQWETAKTVADAAELVRKAKAS